MLRDEIMFEITARIETRNYPVRDQNYYNLARKLSFVSQGKSSSLMNTTPGNLRGDGQPPGHGL